MDIRPFMNRKMSESVPFQENGDAPNSLIKGENMEICSFISRKMSESLPSIWEFQSIAPKRMRKKSFD